MGGKSKRRKSKRAEGSTSQGPPSPTKQSFKKERTKTRDAKLHRMGDGGEEEEEEGDIAPTVPNKASESSQHTAESTSQEEKLSNVQDENIKSAAVTDTKDLDETHNLPQMQFKDSSEIMNGTEDSPITQHSKEVILVDSNKDSSFSTPEELQVITSEEALKQELREATEEEYPPVEEPRGEITCNMRSTGTQEPVKKITFQKSTQTEPVHITCIEKPVKFFISDDSDSDTAIFVDASQGASNGIYGRTYGNLETYTPSDEVICAETDVSYGSGIRVKNEGQGVKPSNQNEIKSYTEINSDTEEGIKVLDDGNSCMTHGTPEMQKSERFGTEKTRHWQHVSHSEESHIQDIELRDGKMTFSYDSFPSQYNARNSSVSDISDKLSQSRSFSNIGDQADIHDASTNEAKAKDKGRKPPSEDSVYLDNLDSKPISDSLSKDADEVSIGTSFDGSVTSKTSFEHNKKTFSNSSKRRLIDKGSSLESVEADAPSRTSVNEFEEQETQDDNFSIKYESVDGIARIFAADSGDPESTSRSSNSESGHFYSTSKISAQDSVDESNKISASATGSSFSVSGDYMPSKSSVGYSSEFDGESLSSTADHLSSKEEILNDLKAKQKVRDSEEDGEESSTETKLNHESNEVRYPTPAWEELSLEDQMQLKKEGICRRFPLRDDKSEIEADAESLFFSLYPEYSPGEYGEPQDVSSSDKNDYPNVSCFRGQTAGRYENKEEVYMATEKSQESKVGEGRDKGPNTGKTQELQQKLSKQKKPKRKTQEINEHEGLGQPECGHSAKEQPIPSMQRPKGDSSASYRRETSSNVYDNSSSSTTFDTKEAKHTLCSETDNVVRQSGQLGKQLHKSAGVDSAADTTADKLHFEENPYEVVESPTSPAEVAEEVFEVENKMDGNPKDRKTFVGIAKDWIKGVTGLGIRRDDTTDKINEKDEGKTNMDFKADSGSSKHSEKVQVKRNNSEDTRETDNLKVVENTITPQTRGLQRRERMTCVRGTDSEINDEGLFESDNLSDSVFKDDSWKGRDSDDNEVQDTKTEDSWVGSQDEEFMFEMIDSVQEQETTNAEAIHNEKAKEAARNVTYVKDSALHGKADMSLFDNQDNDAIGSIKDPKQRKTSEGEEFRQRYDRHEETIPPSFHKDDKKEETGKRPLQRDREGRGGSKKRRQRRRTKSYEDSVEEQAPGQKEPDKGTTSRELRPEEVALPNDGFENESTELNTDKNSEHNREKTHNGAKGSSERKRSFRKSCRDKKYTKSNDEKSKGQELNTYEKGEKDESMEMKGEKQEIEQLDEDTYQISEDLKSQQEKSQRQRKLQSPFTAPPATWSPRVGRREWKNNRKPNGNEQEIQSTNDSETSEEVKEKCNHEDELDQTLQMQLGKSKPRQPGLSLTITKIREDTPIPSPRATHCDFGELSGQESHTQVVTCDQRPLLQALKFPPGVSIPRSPVRPLKALKFPPGISKPLSPVPGPKLVPGFTCRFKVPYLGFQELHFEATSPLPERISEPKFVSASSSNVHKRLLYPARPVSPLRKLVFPEGISRPLSPQPRKPQISNFQTSSSTKNTLQLSCNEESYDYLPNSNSPTVKSDNEESPPPSPKLKKERPRLIIPKPESPTAQVSPPTELINPTSPTLESPEGTSESQVSSDIQVTETEMVDFEYIQPPKKSIEMDLPRRIPAKPVSPLRSIQFPEGISEPLSPNPKKVFLWPFRPSLSKQMSYDEESLQNCNNVCETDEPQLQIPVTKEMSSLDSQEPETHQTLLKEFTFPEGISKPASPKKSYFSNIFIKMTQPLTNLVTPPNNVYSSPSMNEDLPSISNESRELENKEIQSPPTPNDFIESDQTNETPLLQLKGEILASDEDLDASENNKLNATLTTQNVPSTPTLPVSSPETSSDSQPTEQKEFSELPISKASQYEEYTATVSSHYILTSKPKTPEVCTPTSPVPIKAMVSNLKASSPLVIKQTIDFPSDAFPCTLASSALVKSISSLSSSVSIPPPRLNPPSTKSSSIDLETTLPKSTESQILTKPTEPNPQPQNTINGNEIKETNPNLQESKDDPEILQSTPSQFTNLQEINNDFHKSSNSTSLSMEDSKKLNVSLVSEDDNSVSSQATTTVSTTQTCSEVSQELTPTAFPDDNMEQTPVIPSPSLTPEPKSPLPSMDSPREKSNKKATMIHTSEVRIAARYSRGESPCSRGNSPLQKSNQSTTEQSQPNKEKTESTPEILGVRQLREFHQSAQDALRSSPDMLRSRKEGSNSPKSGSQSPHSGCDSPSKKMKRRKRR